MADIQTYDYSDIQRYLQHKMTPQEMHDFEKALMNNPFLADALEGFSSSDAAVTEKHLSEIESELNGEKQKGRVVPMTLQKRTWWKVAAVVLVVVTGGVLTYSLVTEKGIEKNTAQQMAPAEAAEMTTKTDSIGPVEKPLAQVEVLPKKELFNKPRTASPIIRKEKEAPMTATRPMQMKADSPAIAMTDKREESSASMNKNADAVSALNVPESSAANEQVMEAKKIALPSKEDQRLSKVSAATRLTGKTVNVSDAEGNAATAAEPDGGWKNFEQYLNRQTDSLKASDHDKHYNEKIELEFSINNDGHPANIKVPEKADSLTAEKAVKILINGPKWKSKKKDKKVKVIISFE